MIKHHIKSIAVKRLFGRYSYRIPGDGAALSDLNILYGENGLGKTTLLTLVFQMLMIDKFPGYADSISKMAFESFEITLNDGSKISASKDKQLLIGETLFSISNESEVYVKWQYVPGSHGNLASSALPENIDVSKLPKSMRDRVISILNQKEYFNKLGALESSAYLLTSDRMLLGDFKVSDRDNRLGPERSRLKISELVATYRNEAIVDSLKETSRWLQDQFLDSSYRLTGTRNIYEDVITRIASSTYKTRSGLGSSLVNSIKKELLNNISELNKNSAEYLKIGIGDTGVSESLAETVDACVGNRLSLVNEVLGPYLQDLRNRQNRIDKPFNIVKRFILSANRFFKDKRLTFDIVSGLKIFVTVNDELTSDEISPDQLSSGEKQLIFILCRVLSAAKESSIFIIDEPEISLNVLWQRMLVSTLQELSEGGRLQFILASHSMEIIAPLNARVVVLNEIF